MSHNPSRSKFEREVERYLATGESDPLGRALGGDVVDSISRYDRLLRRALLDEVIARTDNRPRGRKKPLLSASACTQLALSRMIDGLFPRAERPIVTAVVNNSILILDRKATIKAIQEVAFLKTAWTLANIYLQSAGVETLAPSEPVPLGLNEERICYVSTAYFETADPFADFIVHEAAHIFHNCKRETVGLPRTRTREWLLSICYAKRETFAYACEFYSRILARGRTQSERLGLLAALTSTMAIGDDRVEPSELMDVLKEAVTHRNGWKRILERCSERTSRPSSRGLQLPPRAPS